MQPAASPMITALEVLWGAIQSHHADVPDVYLVLGTSEDRRRPALGHFSPSRWNPRDPGDLLAEVMVSGEHCKEGAEAVLTTLLHEAAHGLLVTRGDKNAGTSRGGRYHNDKFRRAAEEMLLVVSKDQQGWADTDLSDGARVRYQVELTALDAALRYWRAGKADEEADKPAKAKTVRIALTCSCAPEPRRLLMVPMQVIEGMIECGKCNESFVDRTGRLAEWWLEQEEAGTELDISNVDMEVLTGTGPEPEPEP